MFPGLPLQSPVLWNSQATEPLYSEAQHELQSDRKSRRQIRNSREPQKTSTSVQKEELLCPTLRLSSLGSVRKPRSDEYRPAEKKFSQARLAFEGPSHQSLLLLLLLLLDPKRSATTIRGRNREFSPNHARAASAAAHFHRSQIPAEIAGDDQLSSRAPFSRASPRTETPTLITGLDNFPIRRPFETKRQQRSATKSLRIGSTTTTTTTTDEEDEDEEGARSAALCSD